MESLLKKKPARVQAWLTERHMRYFREHPEINMSAVIRIALDKYLDEIEKKGDE